MFSFLTTYGILFLVLVIAIIFSGIFTVQQGTIGVITMFGKYRRLASPGLNFKIPVFEKIFKRVSIQNRSVELQFQAITLDQANVNFKAMLLYAFATDVLEPIKNEALKQYMDQQIAERLNKSI